MPTVLGPETGGTKYLFQLRKFFKDEVYLPVSDEEIDNP
jgi:hypothetical protein